MRLRLSRAWMQFRNGILRARIELFHRHRPVPDLYSIGLWCSVCRINMGVTEEMRDLFSQEFNTTYFVDAEGNCTRVG